MNDEKRKKDILSQMYLAIENLVEKAELLEETLFCDYYKQEQDIEFFSIRCLAYFVLEDKFQKNNLEEEYDNYDDSFVEYVSNKIIEECVKNKYNFETEILFDGHYYNPKAIHLTIKALLDVIKEGVLIEGYWFNRDVKITRFKELVDKKEIEIYEDLCNKKNFRVLNKDLGRWLIVPEGISFCSNYSKEDTNSLGKLREITFIEKYLIIPPKMFYGCENIKEIKFENSKISEIPEKAFFGCKSLRFLKIEGDTVKIKEIKDQAFAGCELLGEWPNHVKFDELKILGNAVFFNCKKLGHFDFNEKLESIGDLCFYGTHIGSNWYDGFYRIKIHKNTKLGKGVFLGIENIRVYVKKSSVGDVLTKEEKKYIDFFLLKNLKEKTIKSSPFYLNCLILFSHYFLNYLYHFF